MSDSDVMKAAGDFHGDVGQPRLLVPKDVLDDPAALYPGDGVLDPNANPRQLAVAALLRGRQRAPPRLFFSPGRSSGPAAHTPGTRHPCTGWYRAGNAVAPRRRSACHWPCR